MGLLAGLVLIFEAPGLCASSFSFAVVGDTRTEPFVPGGRNQEALIKTTLEKRYIGRKIDLFFDPDSDVLTRVKVTDGKHKVLNLYYQSGWPRIITEQADDSPPRFIMHDSGRQWVYSQIIDTMNRHGKNRTLFLLHGGDIPLFGYPAPTFASNPYWQLFHRDFLSRVPDAPDLYLPGRVMAAVGNHETWMDDNIDGMLTTMPWLKEFGLSSQNRIYDFTYHNCMFIFLDSGGYSGHGTEWIGKHPPFKEQMEYLTRKLTEAASKKLNHVFVVYHKPSYVQVGHDPLPRKQSPHDRMVKFSKDLNIVVFNSHTHTTEQYVVDGIRYLVLGGGGAPQKYDRCENPSRQKEKYWQGRSRTEEYNYLEVRVDNDHLKGIIHRFRPTDPIDPITSVVVFER